MQNSKGFTLIEMLISITVFMLFFAIVTGSYTGLVSANRHANEIQKIYREARFLFDVIAAETRSAPLDYKCFDQTALDVLCIENQNGETQKVIAFIHGNGDRVLFKFDGKQVVTMRRSTTGGPVTDWQPLTSGEVKFDDASFSVFPLKDPYASQNASDDSVQWQPSISISAKIKNNEFHTTYSSRTYGRTSLYAK